MAIRQVWTCPAGHVYKSHIKIQAAECGKCAQDPARKGKSRTMKLSKEIEP